jgi:hypothetical protein
VIDVCTNKRWGGATEDLKVSSFAEFVRNTSYDPEAVRVMSLAYEAALQQLHDRGQPAIVREIIARRLIELAAIGERQPERLCAMVLSQLGVASRTD